MAFPIQKTASSALATGKRSNALLSASTQRCAVAIPSSSTRRNVTVRSQDYENQFAKFLDVPSFWDAPSSRAEERKPVSRRSAPEPSYYSAPVEEEPEVEADNQFAAFLNVPSFWDSPSSKPAAKEPVRKSAKEPVRKSASSSYWAAEESAPAHVEEEPEQDYHNPFAEFLDVPSFWDSPSSKPAAKQPVRKSAPSSYWADEEETAPAHVEEEPEQDYHNPFAEFLDVPSFWDSPSSKPAAKEPVRKSAPSSYWAAEEETAPAHVEEEPEEEYHNPFAEFLDVPSFWDSKPADEPVYKPKANKPAPAKANKHAPASSYWAAEEETPARAEEPEEEYENPFAAFLDVPSFWDSPRSAADVPKMASKSAVAAAAKANADWAFRPSSAPAHVEEEPEVENQFAAYANVKSFW